MNVLKQTLSPIMKNIILSLLVLVSSAGYAQNAAKLGPTEQKLNDAICDCISKQDLAKVSGKEQGTQIYTDCVTQRTDLLAQLAQEHNIELTDQEGMRKLGLEIGKNLMSQNCSAALQLGVKMNQAPTNVDVGITQGIFKRIDTKGFNYIVITEAGKGEKSFLWLTQFPDSEKFMGAPAGLTSKKLSIKWKEIEVYLPEAKGYYKVKEITEITVL